MSQDNRLKSKWMWYPDDFEIYHSSLLHNRREAFGFYFYPMWELDNVHKSVRVYKIVNLTKEEKFKAISNTDNFEILINNVRYKANTWIKLKPGRVFIKLSAFSSDNKFPCFYCYGDSFASNETWSVARYGRNDIPVGTNDMYVSASDDPTVFKFKYKNLKPVAIEKIKDGTLYDFGKELMGKIIIDNCMCDPAQFSIYYGESRDEALDKDNCINLEHFTCQNGKTILKSRALRYVFVCSSCDKYDISLDYEYYETNRLGSYKCSDKLVNKVWETCAHTLSLNTREGFFDGIKRDRWVWGGDAYQSIFANAYLTNDYDVVRRTLTILRGRDISQHINTIVDYSAYWIMSLYEYYIYSGDKEFVKRSYHKAFKLLDLFSESMDEYGFTIGNPKRGDWTFIDWSPIDKTGAVCAEQMLLYRSYICMSYLSDICSDNKKKYFLTKAKRLKENINKMFWDKEKGAYIDSFESGTRNVTRHANILSLLYNVADGNKRKSILKNVIYNDKITPITTPYFKFFEIDALCSLGDYRLLNEMLHSYWGKMVELGATSIWEQFDPSKSFPEHYSMYGKKYGNSLCHAWGASPIYLLGKYSLGVVPTKPGFETFIVKPDLLNFSSISGSVPLGLRGKVDIKANKHKVEIFTESSGGTLILNNNEYEIKANEKLIITY